MGQHHIMKKYRLFFEKIGNIRFIGHLDLLKVIQRAVKASGVEIAVSSGFNPHQLMYFALPLPLGMEGLNEVLDIFVASDKEQPIMAINDYLPNGLKITSYRELADGEKKISSIIRWAKYRIDCDVPQHMLDDYKNKNPEKVIELTNENGCIYAFLAAGSVQNLKPSDMMAELGYPNANIRTARLELL
jgi:radical SAM-linked protein